MSDQVEVEHLVGFFLDPCVDVSRRIFASKNCVTGRGMQYWKSYTKFACRAPVDAVFRRAFIE